MAAIGPNGDAASPSASARASGEPRSFNRTPAPPQPPGRRAPVGRAPLVQRHVGGAQREPVRVVGRLAVADEEQTHATARTFPVAARRPAPARPRIAPAAAGGCAPAPAAPPTPPPG